MGLTYITNPSVSYICSRILAMLMTIGVSVINALEIYVETSKKSPNTVIFIRFVLV